ncbi:MAG TPA: hypothetical protein VI603_08885 [Saprospiraceae bacterium]|nr:hypothetical protein [Saprospiraceae bacterium]
MKPIIPEHIDQNDSELISAYLRGDLTATEKASVEERRKSDTTFQNLFTAHLKLSAATRASNLESKLTMLREHAALKSQTSKVVYLERRRFITRLAAAGVILILLVFGARILIPQENDRIFKAHFSNEIIPGKGELSADQSPDSKAFDHYARKEYTKAAREFDQLLAGQPDEDYLLYAAVSHLGAGHLNRAAELLDRCLITFHNNKPEIIQLQTLVMVRRGKLEEARRILDANATLIPGHRDLEALYSRLQERE